MLVLWGGGRVAEPAQVLQVVEGVGAILQQNQATARSRAVQDALRKALEQAVSELLEPAVLGERPPAVGGFLSTQTPQYIRSYRVLWEYPDLAQKVYKVGLEVEVAVWEVARALQTLGVSQQQGREKDRILVRIVEKQPEQTELPLSGRDGGVLADGLRTQLLTNGFRVVGVETGAAWDGQEHSTLTTGKEVGAEVVLLGWVEVQTLRSEVAGTPLQAVQATAQVQALTTEQGERLALERVQTTALHADASLGGKQALEKAAAALATRLAPALRAYQQRQQGSASTSRDRP
jgi:hypothetical protein